MRTAAAGRAARASLLYASSPSRADRRARTRRTSQSGDPGAHNPRSGRLPADGSIPTRTFDAPELARRALAAALSLGDEVIAVHIAYSDEPQDRDRFRAEWEAWHPDVPLAIVDSHDRDLGGPLADLLQERFPDRYVLVLIAEVEPERLWERILRNNRGNVLERAVRRHTDAVICRMRFPVPAEDDQTPAAT